MRGFLTKDELRRLSGKLAKLSPYHVKDFYRKALEECRLGRGIPQPGSLQEAGGPAARLVLALAMDKLRE